MLKQTEFLLRIACPIILFIVMFGHMTAIQYSAVALLSIGLLMAICSMDRPSLLRWPLILPIIAWAFWSFGAVIWSAYPSVSFHAWLDEILYPIMAFWAFWLVGTRTNHLKQVVLVNWAACGLLALISLLHWGHLQPPTANTGLLHFYNRVGHTSTLALFSITLFTGFMLRPRWWTVGISGIFLCLFIGFATLNRFFWPTVILVLLIALFPFHRRHLLLSILLVVILSVMGVGTLKIKSRLEYHGHPSSLAQHNIKVFDTRIHMPGIFIGIVDEILSDTRPKLWKFYYSVGEQHKWVGVGFGKPLPGLAYRRQMPAGLLKLEPNALTHAHNLFLNTWLQTGIIGLILQSGLFLCLIVRFWRLWQFDQWVCTAGIALVIGMIIKNMTDDFMWQTTMLSFWSFAGLLLGQGERQTEFMPPIDKNE